MPRTAGALIALMSSFTFAALAASDTEYVIAIDGYDDRPAAWIPLQRHLQSRKLSVRFEVQKDAAALEKGLRDGTIHGAILSPYRYVILASNGVPLQVAAGIQRGGTIRDVKPCVDAVKERALTPQTHYYSVLLARTNSGVWPIRESPDGNVAKVTLGVYDRHSTSQFLYPADYLHEEIKTLKLQRPHVDIDFAILLNDRVISFTDQEADPANALGTVAGNSKGDLGGHERVLEELRRQDSKYSFVGVSSHRWDPIASIASDLQEVWRSEPIPFDPLALSTKLHETIRRDLAQGFLSTRHVTPDERDEIFPVRETQPSTSHDATKTAPATNVVCERSPDIHAFIEVDDSDYDGIRRRAVRLAGGIELRMALSANAHPRWGEDKIFFEKVKSALLLPAKPQRPVYLDYGMPSKMRFDELARALERGEFDIAELTAREAGRLKFEQKGVVLARNRYRDRRLTTKSQRMTPPVTPDIDMPGIDLVSSFDHRLVIVMNENADGDLATLITSGKVLAIPSVASSDAYSYARFFFDELRGTPIAAERFCTVLDARGAFHAVLDELRSRDTHTSEDKLPSKDQPASNQPSNPCDKRPLEAPAAILPEFELMRLRHFIPAGGISVMTDDALSVPNAMLVMSTRFLPVDEDMEDLSNGWLYRMRSLLDLRSTPLEDPELFVRKQAIRRLRNALDMTSQGTFSPVGKTDMETGFRGAMPADRSVAIDLERVHAKFAPNRLGLAIGAIGLLIVGSVLLVLMAGRKAGQQPIVTEPMQFGSDRGIQEFIRSAIALREKLCDKGKMAVFAEALGGKDEVKSRSDELDQGILRVLSFYGSEARTVNAEEYFAALRNLAKALRSVLEPISEYNRLHDPGIAGDGPVVMQSGSTTESKLLAEILSVALEVSKLLTGRK